MEAAGVVRRPSQRAQSPGSNPSAQEAQLDAVCSSQGDGVRMPRVVTGVGPGPRTRDRRWGDREAALVGRSDVHPQGVVTDGRCCAVRSSPSSRIIN